MLSDAVLAELHAVVGGDAVITDPVRLLVYESDGLTAYRRAPLAVVLPRTTAEVQRVLQTLSRAGVPFVPRGAGTGLSGGCLAGPDTVVIGTARMNRIVSVDPENRTARVQPGVVNAHLTEATQPHGLYYAPDPSSQSTCTLGGNVAENSGGPHCLKYGVTSRYVTGLTVVLPSGDKVEFGGFGRALDLDLVGLFVGSEGNFGIATEIETRLLPLPESVRTLLAIFDRVEDAGRAVTSIIAEGLLPAALEIIDGPTIRAVEASIFAAGYPVDAGAALVVEFDGLEAGLNAEADLARASCEKAGAREVRVADSAEERLALWRGRKKAFGAMGRIAPDLLVQDATVPRTRLPDVLGRIEEIGSRYKLKVANVFHAGDGNLHPNILFDRRDADEVARVEEASQEIMQACVDVGGTITGEHGVGLDKRVYMSLIHDAAILDAMATVKLVFDPNLSSNPGKVLPDEVWARAQGPTLPERLPVSDWTFDGVREALPQSVRMESADGWSTPAGGAVAVAFPKSTEEAAQIFEVASRERIRVAPAGRGTWLSAWGTSLPTPGPVDLIVSASAMQEVTTYEPADLTFTAGAGLTIGQLIELTRANRQWLAVDPSPTGTLGGLVATASGGPLRSGYGGPRDHILGMTLVTGDGRVLRLGGRVVKNVAGFDLLRLAVGSWGSMGLVTEVTVRLNPLPQTDVSLVWRADQADSLVEAARRLATCDVVPHALELVRRTAWAEVGAPAALILRTLGSEEVVDRSVEIFEGAAGRAPDVVTRDDASRSLQSTLAPSSDAGAVVRIWRAPSKLGELATLADGSAARAAIHVTEGMLRLEWNETPDAEERGRLGLDRQSSDQVRFVLGDAANGGAGAEGNGARVDLLRGLRATFDPAGIVWPGVRE